MNYDKDKVDDMVLALLHLTFDGQSSRAWKGFDWDAMNRLHDKGFIDDPKDLVMCVLLTEEGQRRAKAFFRQYFYEK